MKQPPSLVVTLLSAIVSFPACSGGGTEPSEALDASAGFAGRSNTNAASGAGTGGSSASGANATVGSSDGAGNGGVSAATGGGTTTGGAGRSAAGGRSGAGGAFGGGTLSNGGAGVGRGGALGFGSTSSGGAVAGRGGAMGLVGAAAGRESRGGASQGGVQSAGANAVVGGGAAGGATGTCPYVGHVTYVLAKAGSPTAEQQAAYDRITKAMDEAVRYYNCYTNITKALNVSYVPTVGTADGNINGSIRFGSTGSMNRVTAMHEISHTVGIGTASRWASLVVDKKFTGSNARAELLAIPNRLGDSIGADSQHFWPYGLNFESEGKNESDLIGHCRMVVAIRKDLGL